MRVARLLGGRFIENIARDPRRVQEDESYMLKGRAAQEVVLVFLGILIEISGVWGWSKKAL